MTLFLEGRYDTGVVSGALVLMDDELQLSARQKECVVSSAVLLAAVGAVVGGVASERWGRKLPIQMASVLFVVGAVVVGFAPSYHVRATGAGEEVANTAQLLRAATPRRRSSSAHGVWLR